MYCFFTESFKKIVSHEMFFFVEFFREICITILFNLHGDSLCLCFLAVLTASFLLLSSLCSTCWFQRCTSAITGLGSSSSHGNEITWICVPFK